MLVFHGASCVGGICSSLPGMFRRNLEELFSFAPGPGRREAQGARKIAPDFTLNDASGKAVKLSDFKGKVVLLNFWATWCEGCKVEIPEFIEFQNKYKDSGLVVIGVSTDKDGWKVVKPFVDEKKINYTVVLGDDEICKLYSVEAMPVTVLIDREGRIAASHEGVMKEAVGESEIKTLVQERAKNAAK